MFCEVSLTPYTPLQGSSRLHSWVRQSLIIIGYVMITFPMAPTRTIYHSNILNPKSSAPQTITSNPQASKPLSPKSKSLHRKSTARSPKPMKTLYPNNAITTQISILIRGRPVSARTVALHKTGRSFAVIQGLALDAFDSLDASETAV